MLGKVSSLKWSPVHFYLLWYEAGWKLKMPSNIIKEYNFLEAISRTTDRLTLAQAQCQSGDSNSSLSILESHAPVSLGPQIKETYSYISFNYNLQLWDSSSRGNKSIRSHSLCNFNITE